MATHTTYYNLTKPAQNDKVNIGVLNDNADIIDTTLHNKVNTDELTADNVMMSDGVTSVEEVLDATTQRTKTGTTLAQLVSAVKAIVDVDVSKIDKIKVGAYILTPQQTIEFVLVSADSSSENIFVLNTRAGTFQRYAHAWNSTSVSVTDVSVSSWTIYYHGAEVTT